MATHSPLSNGASSPRYREKDDGEEVEAHPKSNGSRNRNASGSRSSSSSRSSSPCENKSEGNGRRSSRSPSKGERRHHSLSREDGHRERNGHGKKRDRRSRSRSLDSHSPPRYSRRTRSRSRSPGRSGSPHSGRGSRRTNVSDPPPSRCVAAFGLSMYTRERELRDIFSHYGPLEEVQVVYDKQSGRSRGFAFIYFRNVDDAIMARNKLSGQDVDGRQIRVDFSTTERAHSPTPGIYMGRVSAAEREKYRRGELSTRSDRSPPSRRRYGRSRSRSYSRSRSPSPPHRRRDY